MQDYVKTLEKVFKHSFVSIAEFFTHTGALKFIIADPESDYLETLETTYAEVNPLVQEYLLHPDDRAFFEELIQTNNLIALAAQGKPEYTYEFRFRFNMTQKTYRWLKIRIFEIERCEEGFHILCCFQDISELKERELQEQHNNRCHMLALKNAFEELYEIDLENNRYYAFNVNDRNKEKDPMYVFQDFMQVIRTHVHPDDRSLCENKMDATYIRTCFEQGMKQIGIQYRIRLADDLPYQWVFANILPLEMNQYRKTAFMLMKDITEEKKRVDLQHKLELLRGQMKAQIHYYEAQEEMRVKLRSFRHDLKNHLLVLESLHKEGNDEEFYEYIKNMRGTLKRDKTFIRSGNTILDALLNEKIRDAGKLGIQVHTSIKIKPKMPLSGMDICILFGNAFDNAIEASSKSQEKTIQLQLVYAHNLLVLRLINSISKDLHQQPITFQTTKENQEDHGFGILNMQRIVEAHNGDFYLEKEEDQVILQISIQLEEEEG